MEREGNEQTDKQTEVQKQDYEKRQLEKKLT